MLTSHQKPKNIPSPLFGNSVFKTTVSVLSFACVYNLTFDPPKCYTCHHPQFMGSGVELVASSC